MAYLALVWHSVVLLKFDYWTGVLGPLMAVLMGAASVAALMVLLRRCGGGPPGGGRGGRHTAP